MYKVIKGFHDLQDVKKTKSGEIYHEYKVGDAYPRKGVSPSEDRIAELAGSDNKQGIPLIEFVGEVAVEEVEKSAKVVMKKKASDV